MENLEIITYVSETSRNFIYQDCKNPRDMDYVTTAQERLHGRILDNTRDPIFTQDEMFVMCVERLEVVRDNLRLGA